MAPAPRRRSLAPAAPAARTARSARRVAATPGGAFANEPAFGGRARGDGGGAGVGEIRGAHRARLERPEGHELARAEARGPRERVATRGGQREHGLAPIAARGRQT